MSRKPAIHPTRRTFLAQSAAALAFSGSPLAHASLAGTFAKMPPAAQPLAFGEVVAGGDLAHRTTLNFGRLRAEIYRPPLLFRQTNWHFRATLAGCTPVRIGI